MTHHRVVATQRSALALAACRCTLASTSRKNACFFVHVSRAARLHTNAWYACTSPSNTCASTRASRARHARSSLRVSSTSGSFVPTAVNNGGSGGAFRLVAPVVSGSVEINVQGSSYGSAGRVRVDANDVSGLNRNVVPHGSLSIGSVLVARLTPEPTIDITEIAGSAIPENSTLPVQIILPNGSNPNQNVTLQVRNFATKVPIEVVLIPDSGPAVVANTLVDNTTENPARITVPLTFPVNVGVTVQAWVRGKP